MLSEDVVVWTDGGGKVRAAVRPVVGSHRSSRFLMNVAKKVAGVPQRGILNGQPASVFMDGATVVAAMVLDIMDGIDRRRSGWCRTPTSSSASAQPSGSRRSGTSSD